MGHPPAILLIGVGRWGVNHLRVWLRLHAAGLCRLVGVQDTDEQRRKEAAKEFGVKTFSDYPAKEKIDAVDIVVPTYNHFQVAKAMLCAGKDVLVEKPVTQTVAEALELEKLKKKHSRILMVGHLFRYNPAADYAGKLLAEKELGTIRFLRGRFMGFRFQEHDAGILATTSIHFIYLSSYLIGKAPVAVWAKTEHVLGTKLDDLSLIRLDYGSEFSLLESDYFTPGKWRTFDIIGSQGALFVDLLNQEVSLHRKRHVRVRDRYEAYDGGVVHRKLEFKEPLELELRHFLKCVQDRSQPLTSITEGINTIRLVEAAYESARLDKTITLN